MFFTFTIMYVIVMGAYLFYLVGQESSDGPIINCFLDEVPAIYGKRAMKIINSVVVGVSIAIIFLSAGVNWYINAKYYNGSNDYSQRPPINKWYVAFMWLFVFAGETVLAASVEKTLMEYGQFVSDSDRAASQAWQFGQIIPFMMLLQPLLEALRAVLPKVVLKHNSMKAVKQSRGDVQTEEHAMSMDGKASRDVSQNEVDMEVEKKIAVTTNSMEIHEVV